MPSCRLLPCSIRYVPFCDAFARARDELCESAVATSLASYAAAAPAAEEDTSNSAQAHKSFPFDDAGGEARKDGDEAGGDGGGSSRQGMAIVPDAAAAATAAAAAAAQQNLWIMKPVGLSRGRGIFVLNDIGAVQASACAAPSHPPASYLGLASF